MTSEHWQARTPDEEARNTAGVDLLCRSPSGQRTSFRDVSGATDRVRAPFSQTLPRCSLQATSARPHPTGAGPRGARIGAALGHKKQGWCGTRVGGKPAQTRLAHRDP